MGLERLTFVYPDVTVELGTELWRHESQHLPLYCVEAKLTFPSNSIRRGDLIYDTGFYKFYSAITDLWEKRIDWNAPDCDMKLVERCEQYRLEMSGALRALLAVKKICCSELSAD
mgnify:CR=1 FL=1